MTKPADDRRAKFAREYVKDLNGQQAAIRAGYAPGGAKVTASRLLTDVNVLADIQKRQAKAVERSEIDAAAVIRELGRIALADMRKVARWGRRTHKVGFDADGKVLPADQFMDAVVVHEEEAPFVELFESDQLDDDTAAAISEIRMTKDGPAVKMHNKLAALNTLAQHFGLLKQDDTGGTQVNFFIIGDPDSDPRWLERKRRAIEGETAE